jgi:hypothetical protein
MKISRTAFVLLFLVFGFAFVFGTTSILNLPPESFLGTEAQGTWRSAISTLVSPIKIVLIGPLLPFIKILHKDPDTPPPFFLVMFAFYWAILAVVLHYLLGRTKHHKSAA